jgi:hypothetical protein
MREGVDGMTPLGAVINSTRVVTNLARRSTGV